MEKIGFRLVHPAFEALFELMALVVVLQAWIKRDVFFSHGYGKVLAVFAIGIIIINLLLFCTKTAALECVLSIFALWVYALCKKRYVFVGVSAVGVLLCIGFLTFYSPKVIFSHFHSTIHASRDFLKGGDEVGDSSFVPRMHTYRIGLEMFREKPLTGRGPFYITEFGKRYERYLDKSQGTIFESVLVRSHNQLLDILNFCGIVGGAVFVWLFLCILRDVWRRKSLFWWIWFAGLLAICVIDMPFNRITGLIYLCGFHGILFCELTSDFLHPEDADKPLVSEKSAE
ncbi:MAG: O-antigen ligase family protein, partial [Bacteroidales bacterium]|nr:O-antigen ligase family protein [Bacteroidales bacterium]